jgi:hypothetical protein
VLVQGVDIKGDVIKLVPTNIKKKVSTENIETTMSKYQSQVNQANYLEHMTVQDVLFA